MPRLLLLLALLAAVASGPATAQTGAVVGRVVDVDSDLPLPTASVALYRDTTFVTGASADIDGNVRVRGVAAGTYAVRISFIGYETTTLEAVTVAAGETDFGTIRMSPEPSALAEVSVSAERPPVQTQIDRTVYTTADDPVAEGGNATDVLATLPSVDVDIDGNVSLRGAGNVAVFINGRPAPVSGDFLASYLASLPAGAVERVEIIPNPSAAFEPDGVGGIINIVLKQDADPGLGGTLTVGTDTQGGYDATGALTYGRGPWTLAATYGFRNDARAGGGTVFRRNLYEADPTTLSQAETEDRLRTSNLLNLSADYALSRRTTLTSQLQLGTRSSGETELGTYDFATGAGTPIYSVQRTADEDEDGRSLDARLGFRQSYGERHTLAVEARGQLSAEDGLQTYDEALMAGAGDLDAPQRVTQDGSEREASLSADYSRPLALDGSRFDVGYKGEWQSQHRALFSETLAGGAYTPDVGLNNTFDYAETVNAVYGQLAGQFGILGLQGGLRYEIASRTFDLLTTGETNETTYRSLFPSAFLTVAPTEATTFKASYSRRINRPRTWSLNPFPSFDDPYNVRQGNPELRPEYVDAVELGVTQFVPWGTLSLSPYYRHTTDVIRHVSYLDANGVRIGTSTNLDTADSYGVELVSSFENLGGLSGYVSLEGFRIQTEGATADTELSNDAFGWGGRANATYRLGDRLGLGALDVQATARYSAPMTTEQGRMGARSWIDLAFRQKLLDDRASLTVQLRDPLGMAGFAYTLDQPTLYQEFERDWGAQQVGVTFAYSFGHREERRDRQREGGQGGEEYQGEAYTPQP